jgi:hypothetical protein
MGSSKSKENTDTKWNNMKTEDISSYIPHLNSLSKDAKQLIANLTIPTFSETQSSEFDINKFIGNINNSLGPNDKKAFNKIIDEMSSEVSATSPFISSDVYKNMLNSTTSSDQPVKQSGGKRQIKKSKGKKMRGGMDDSDTSSTDSDLDDMSDSSDSDLDSSSDKKKKDRKKEKKLRIPVKLVNTESSQNGGSDLSYLSSSANTDSNKSITDENGLQSTSISVNTEDINMVSEY